MYLSVSRDKDYNIFMEKNGKEKKAVDGIKAGAENRDTREIAEKQSPAGNGAFSCKVMDYKVPKRGIWWHVIFFLAFIVSGGLSIYLTDWALLFFIIVFAGYTLFRGTQGTTFDLLADKKGIRINEKYFAYGIIESFYFSGSGESTAVSFQFTKKLYPKLTFLILDGKNVEALRKALGSKMPETEAREEVFSDFFIRKLKL